MYFEDKGHVYEEPTEMKWLAKPYNKKKKIISWSLQF